MKQSRRWEIPHGTDRIKTSLVLHCTDMLCGAHLNAGTDADLAVRSLAARALLEFPRLVSLVWNSFNLHPPSPLGRQLKFQRMEELTVSEAGNEPYGPGLLTLNLTASDLEFAGSSFDG